MQKHRDLTLTRLKKFANALRRMLYLERHPVALKAWAAPIPDEEPGRKKPHGTRPTYDVAMQGEFTPIEVGAKFGPRWSTHWVQVDGEIPETWAGREVHLLWDSGSEACVWIDGVPMQGLTGRGTRIEYVLSRSARPEPVRLHIEAACNGMFGVGDAAPEYELATAELGMFDHEVWDFLHDFVTIAEMARHLPPDTPRGGQALRVANEMVNITFLDDRDTWPEARKLAAQFYAETNGKGQHRTSAIGHAHIDTAWLWPIAETMRKCTRTFATAVAYMDDYPEYLFSCSQAQQYEWMKTQQPALYEKIKAKIEAKQFIPVGGTWVEPDCNIPSGESLVRQFLYGQRFFESEFGIHCDEFWNPDVFGYSGQLPQIMAGAEIRYFLTQKLSWNQFNSPPCHTFMWEGIDGTSVLTHFPPANTYNGDCSAEQLLHSVKNYKDHTSSRESYYLFGYGDGGGGPTREMIERLRRMRDVDGLPTVAQRTPTDFFARLEGDAEDLLKWVGELYFELHRATYTSQAANKRDNRRCERILHDVEMLWSLGAPSEYPKDEIDRIWKIVLTNQFHDIIPGSSIREVYEDSALEYADVLASLRNLQAQGVSKLDVESGESTGKGDTSSDKAADTTASRNGQRLLTINTLTRPRREVVDLPGGGLGVVRAPAMGYRVAEPEPVDETVRITQTDEGVILENLCVLAKFRKDGRLVSLFDKHADREAIVPGEPGNHLVMFDDRPNNWEAWDVDAFHLEKSRAVAAAESMIIVEEDALRVGVEFEYTLSDKSTMKQTVRLTAVSPLLEFDTYVDWHDDHQFLKVEFPWQVRAMNATYEIQFGHLERPTHMNTSWDMAKFEVCGHTWADLSEPDFGVAVINDCKYGYGCAGHVMRLSLVRGPQQPDKTADQGEHWFRYAVLPHAGSFRDAGVIDHAHRFNQPLLVRASDAAATEKSWFTVDRAAVVIDTVKRTEDGEDLIVRLYESHGTRCRARLSSTLPVKWAAACNLLERQDEALKWEEGGVDLELTPFQVKTLKLSAGA